MSWQDLGPRQSAGPRQQQIGQYDCRASTAAAHTTRQAGVRSGRRQIRSTARVVMRVVFACDDLPATFQALQAKGVQFTQAPVETPFGTWATFCDIDGNEFGLSQPE